MNEHCFFLHHILVYEFCGRMKVTIDLFPTDVFHIHRKILKTFKTGAQLCRITNMKINSYENKRLISLFSDHTGISNGVQQLTTATTFARCNKSLLVASSRPPKYNPSIISCIPTPLSRTTDTLPTDTRYDKVSYEIFVFLNKGWRLNEKSENSLCSLHHIDSVDPTSSDGPFYPSQSHQEEEIPKKL